jgi:hypothetical protein
MLYIRVELWPHGDKEQSRLLCEGRIHNVGGTTTMGEYKAQFSRKGAEIKDVAREPEDSLKWLKNVRVSKFPRQRLLAWDLLLWSLAEAFGFRVKKELKQ